MASGQRSYQFDAPNRLFVEGKELFSLKNYSGCIDKLEAYKQHSTDADLIQEADYMLVYSAYEQGRLNAVELLKDYPMCTRLPSCGRGELLDRFRPFRTGRVSESYLLV